MFLVLSKECIQKGFRNSSYLRQYVVQAVLATMELLLRAVAVDQGMTVCVDASRPQARTALAGESKFSRRFSAQTQSFG